MSPQRVPDILLYQYLYTMLYNSIVTIRFFCCIAQTACPLWWVMSSQRFHHHNSKVIGVTYRNFKIWWISHTSGLRRTGFKRCRWSRDVLKVYSIRILKSSYTSSLTWDWEFLRPSGLVQPTVEAEQSNRNEVPKLNSTSIGWEIVSRRLQRAFIIAKNELAYTENLDKLGIVYARREAYILSLRILGLGRGKSWVLWWTAVWWLNRRAGRWLRQIGLTSKTYIKAATLEKERKVSHHHPPPHHEELVYVPCEKSRTDDILDQSEQRTISSLDSSLALV